jgi:filamin
LKATFKILKLIRFNSLKVDASAAGAGNLEIIVSANGRNVPNYVQSEGNAKFRVNFKPTEPSTHVLSVKFNGEPVPGIITTLLISLSNIFLLFFASILNLSIN